MRGVTSTMLMTIVFRCATVLLGAAAGPLAFAEDAAPPAQSEPPSKPAASSKLICTQEAVMGSNIKKKTCRTQAQIDAQREASQHSMGDFSAQQGRNNGKSGG